MLERLFEAGAKGIIAGIIGVILYGLYLLIKKISNRNNIKEK